MDPATAEKARAILEKVKDQLRMRYGGLGFRDLVGAFDIADREGKDDDLLDPEEFGILLRNAGVFLGKAEEQILRRLFDMNNDGVVSLNEFLFTLRGGLTPRQERIVEQAFRKLDRDGSGVVDINDIADVYDTSRHPEVMAKLKSSSDVLNEFLNRLQPTGASPDGRVTLTEFKEYYSEIAAGMRSEDLFVANVCKAWGIEESAGPGASLEKVLVKRLQEQNKGADEVSDRRTAWRRVFNWVDLDKSGIVTPDELGKVFDYLNIKVSPSEVKDMFNRVDLDGSGAIPVEEFVQALMNIADS